jgi:hypothetical protein
MRRELTRRSASEREMKGKSSSTEARASWFREPKCLKRVAARFLRAKDQPQVLHGIQRCRTIGSQAIFNRGTPHVIG